MATDPIDAALADFLARSRFASAGAMISDLDGTALHESEGRLMIAPEIVAGLKALQAKGRPIVLNTLRFPLNVLKTFGREWYEISSRPVPLVSLNGAIIGQLDLDANGEPCFVELCASPLRPDTITATIDQIEAMVNGGVDELLLFHYPRDWRQGEIIWTPVADRVAHVTSKYASASLVTAEPLAELRARLACQDVCMLFLLIETSADRLMAYQHARPTSFVTAEGIDKLAGARLAAETLGFSLADSVGAGDTPMDSFLDGVGLSVHVGPMELAFAGKVGTLKLASVAELGGLLSRLATLNVA